MQISSKKAVKMANNINYDNWTAKEIFLFQISQEKLAMDFDIFHEATENVLDRPVFTHEFANLNKLFEDFLRSD